MSTRISFVGSVKLAWSISHSSRSSSCTSVMLILRLCERCARFRRADMHPLITKDPVTGGELIVTRLECPASGILIEGRFSLGWIARLTPEQLVFVGILVKQRGNLQKVAVDLDVSYNTARNRMYEIVAALEDLPARKAAIDRLAVLERLSAGELSFEEAMYLLKGSSLPK